MELELAVDRVRLRLSGELDVLSSRIFGSALEQACTARRAVVVVDLSDLAYCDSSGIRALVEATRSCTDQHIELFIVGATGLVARVFRIVRGSELFHMSDVEPL